MGPVSLLAILQLMSEYMALGTTIAALIKKLQSGQEVTDEEIDVARQEMKDAVAGWDAIAGDNPVE